jgi:hypothetical protein
LYTNKKIPDWLRDFFMIKANVLSKHLIVREVKNASTLGAAKSLGWRSPDQRMKNRIQ